MKAYYIIPARCPFQYLEEDDALDKIKEIRFFKLFSKFGYGDITFQRMINDEYYAEWLCGGCTKSMDKDCEFRYCGLGGKIVPESPGVVGYKVKRANKKK